MRKICLFYFSIVVLCFVGCEEIQTDSIHDMPIIKLKAVNTNIKDVVVRYPFRIRLNDSVLYIMDLHGQEYYVNAFTYPELKFIKSIGKKGSGPEELLDSENIRFDKQNNLWLLDANRKKLICFTDTGQREILLSKSLIRTLDFDFYKDSLFIVPDYTGNYRYSIVNSQGIIVENRSSIPAKKKNARKSNIALAQAWRSFIDYNPDNGILAMVTQLGEVIELYDVRNDKIINTYYGNSGEPVYRNREGMAIPDGIMGYSDIHVGSKYIYALFWGQKMSDIRQGKIKYEGGDQIHVFDLKGNSIKTYKLERYITGFEIDEKNQIILALDVNSNQPLFKFNIQL